MLLRAFASALAVLLATGCTNLVSFSPSDFPAGYATIYTTHYTDDFGEECSQGTIDYFYYHKKSEDIFVSGGGYPYYAAPGTFDVRFSCPSPIDQDTRKCCWLWYHDGGPRTTISVEAGKEYVMDCRHGKPRISLVDVWDAENATLSKH